MAAPTCSWSGYEFQIHPYGASWNTVAGVYIFAAIQGGRWRALYVGETESLARRIPGHERWQEAQRLGATHVHARAESFRRGAIEQELIHAYQPPLNG